MSGPVFDAPQGRATASPWVQRWAHQIARGGSVLDVACGSGRHVRWLHARGFAVTGIDSDGAALAPLQDAGQMVTADIKNAPWPLQGQRFDAVIVTNYLWRPLVPTLLAALQPGGVYIHETFADGQQHIGKPSRPAFLLQPGELIGLVAGLRTIAYEDVLLTDPPRCVQRIVARSGGPAGHLGGS